MMQYKNVLISNPPVSLIFPGIFVYREMIQLGGGHKWIRGVIIDNANSPLPVYVWQGRSPNIGTPMVVLPAWSRGFSLSGTSGIYVLITGTVTPTTTGTVQIGVSDEPVTAFASDARTQTNAPVPPIVYPPQTPVI